MYVAGSRSGTVRQPPGKESGYRLCRLQVMLALTPPGGLGGHKCFFDTLSGWHSQWSRQHKMLESHLRGIARAGATGDSMQRRITISRPDTIAVRPTSCTCFRTDSRVRSAPSQNGSRRGLYYARCSMAHRGAADVALFACLQYARQAARLTSCRGSAFQQ